MAKNIKILKLITGQDLMAEVLPSITGLVKIKNAIMIVVIPNRVDPKTPNVGFGPWAEFSEDKEFTLDTSHVLAIMTPIKEFVTQYNSLFSGIVMPAGSNLLIPQ
jgi:hypothetical protein